MHIDVVLSAHNMEGPIHEHNEAPDGFEWNGAIAYLDRDGVLNYGSPNYINTPDELVIMPDVKEAVQKLRNSGYKIAITTNQSAIMRGLWGEDRIHEIHRKLQQEIGTIDALMTCPHRNRDRCKCRKPQPGMLNMASDLIRGESHSGVNWWKKKPQPIHKLDVMVGDRDSDLGAGWAVGARLFKVNDEIGLPEVIDRIINGEPGDDFNPV